MLESEVASPSDDTMTLPYIITEEEAIKLEIKQECNAEGDAGFVSGCEDDDSSSGPAHSDDSGLPPVKRARPDPLERLQPSLDHFRPWGEQTEPLALVKKPKTCDIKFQAPLNPPNSRVICDPPRVPPHPAVTREIPGPPPRRDQRNYKNMTRERRIEANARERTRVHTISAAFETLRQAVPSYSHGQKLSKLSVLRVACAYIAALGADLESDKVDEVTDTIHTEGKLRKRKDET